MNFQLKRSNLFNLATPLLLATIFASGVVTLQKSQLKTEETKLTKAEYLQQDKARLASLNALKSIPSFGFDNLLADWTYLQFLDYFGDSEARETVGYSLSPEYFEAVVDRDPRFVRAYFHLSPATSIFAGKADRSVALLEQGLKFLSPEIHEDAYYLWIYKGIDENLFLGDTKAAQKSYETAAEWAEKTDTPRAKSSAINARQTAQFLAQDPDSVVAQIGAWTMVLTSTSDEKTIQKAIQNIERLGGQVIATGNGEISVQLPPET